MQKLSLIHIFQIAGVAVTGDNRNDLSVINGVEGNVNYDPQTNTLTLEDATISLSLIHIYIRTHQHGLRDTVC